MTDYTLAACSRCKRGVRPSYSVDGLCCECAAEELRLLRAVAEAYFALADMSITEYAKHVRDAMSWHCLDSATISRWRTWLAALEAYAKWQEGRDAS